MKSVRGDTEHAHQKAFFQWVRLKRLSDERFKNIFAIPNGGARHKAVAGKMQAEGTEKGVPDICVAWPNYTWEKLGMYIEMKRRGGRISPEQNDWHSRLRRAGYMVVICYSVDEAIEIVERYFSGR